MTQQKLYFYSCMEAYKYPRSGYTWNYTLKKVKEDIEKKYVGLSNIRIRLIREETEEYCKQAIFRKSEVNC